MKKIGCLIGLVGLLMFVGSFGMFVMVGVRAAQARKVASLELGVGKTATTETLTVATDKACQVAVQIHVESESIDRGAGTDSADRVQYEFPFSYKVLDADGKLLHSQDTAIAYDQGTKENSSKSVTGESGSERGRCNFEKFDVPAPGVVRVEATVGPDTEYHAEAKALTLEVYDSVARHGSAVGGALALMFIGPVVGLLGLFLFIIGLFSGKKAAAPQAASYDPGPPMDYEIQD